MQRITYWFRTEYQRAVAILPKLLLQSAVIAVVMGVMLTALVSFMEAKQEDEQSKIRIGYVAEDDLVTRLLVAYVAGMDSVDDWCRFVSVTEEKGKERLQEGKLDALLILPDNVVDEILTGTNAPATLLLPRESSALGIVFEELADAGIRMLSIAQGEIYTIYELAGALEFSSEELLAMCDDINGYNLGLVIGREDLFETEMVSVTGNEGIAVYYGSALLAFYLFLCGVLFGRYSKHNEQEQLLVWKRLGISPVIQTVGRILMIALLLLAALLPMAVLWLLPWLRDVLLPAFTWQSILLILLSIIFTAAYFLLLYQISEQHRTAVVLVGLSAVIQGYIAGFMIPMVLLPQVVQRIAFFIPANYVRLAFSMFFSGDTENAGSICIGLLLFSICFILADILLMYQKTRLYAGGRLSEPSLRKEKTGRLTGTLSGIYTKRLLYRKSLWCSLIVMILISVGFVSMERESETKLLAAFYDESGEWEELLCGYEGYIQFLACDSEEEVRELVLHNKVECGYYLSNDWKERAQHEDAEDIIRVYKDADALMTDTVNEILFEQLFTVLSKEWFTDYIRETDSLLAVLEQKMTDGSTFSIKKEYWNVDGKEQSTEERTTYPVAVVIGTVVLLCGISGIWETVEDYRKYHFFKRKAKDIILVNVLQPVFCVLVMGVIIILLNSY